MLFPILKKKRLKMNRNNSTTFDGQTTGTITYPNINHEVYNEPCHVCHGCGHVHCLECKKESPCPHCNGSGKEHVYEGNVYKIWWNVPYPEPWKPSTTC